MHGLAKFPEPLEATSVPLNSDERFEVFSLGLLLAPAPATYTTPREELEALRALLQGELQVVRALTQGTRTPWHLDDDPEAELRWRRRLVEAKVRAEEVARNAEDVARKENDRREREAEAVAAEPRRKLEAWQAKQHVTLSAAELRWQEELRQDWAANGDTEELEELSWSVPGDCGRKHWSESAAFACANVRKPPAPTRPTGCIPAPTSTPPAEEVRIIRTPGYAPAPNSPATSARPAPLTSGPMPAQAARATSSTSTSLTHIHLVSSAPAAPPALGGRTSAPSPPRLAPPRSPSPDQAVSGPEQRVPGGRMTPAARPATSRPAPPRSPSPASTLTPPSRVDAEAAVLVARILAVVRSGSHMSVNGIVHALVASGGGARRQQVYAAVAAMLADGRMVKVNELFRAG